VVTIQAFKISAFVRTTSFPLAMNLQPLGFLCFAFHLNHALSPFPVYQVVDERGSRTTGMMASDSDYNILSSISFETYANSPSQV
jgi:hypothetical protein